MNLLKCHWQPLTFAAWIFATVSVFAAPPANPRGGPVQLRCELMEEPLGVAEARPRLSWQMASPERGQLQTARQILVATSPELLAQDQGDLWDSGRVASQESVFIEYAGKPLASAQKVFWKVRVWDKAHTVSPWSQPASWQAGMLREEDWQGVWIGAAASPQPAFNVDKKKRTAAPLPTAEELAALDQEPRFAAVLLRKETELPKAVRLATLFVCGLGLYEMEINGERVGNRLLEPAHTHYDHRVFYQVYDASALIKKGRNALGVTLGNGWYHIPTDDLFGNARAAWRGAPKLRLRLEIEFEDGTRQAVTSDASWKWSTGAITFNCLRGGEDVDARHEKAGWSKPGYDDRAWQAVTQVPPPKGKLVPELLYPVRRVGTAKAVKIERGKTPGEWIFDFGANFAGWCRLSASGSAGQTVELEFPGASSHTFGRYQIDRFTFAGKGRETFEPRFTHHAFQKVIVRGLQEEPKPETLLACSVHTELPSAGSFSCSDEKLNTLQALLLRTCENYLLHFPADPTREKVGWSQDAQNMFPTQCYNFESTQMYRKWFDDMLDAQDQRGFVPPIMPTSGWTYNGSWNGIWWGGMVVYLPWRIYEFSGDRKVLADGYPAMKAFVDWLHTIEGKTNGVWCSQPKPFGDKTPASLDGILAWGLGDWGEVGTTGYPKRTPVAVTATCGYAHFNRLLARAAAVMGKKDDAQHYAAEAERITAALNRVFLDSATGQYAPDSQTAQLLPLVFDLVPKQSKALATQQLAASIAAARNHVTTGFEGTPFLLGGLCDLELPDLAWSLATQPDAPGWFDLAFKRRVTTFMEFWNGSGVQMPSCQGPIGEWFFRDLAGIRPDASAPGFKSIVIAPQVCGDLSWVKASYRSLYGEIATDWKRDGQKFRLKVTIPPNTTATVLLPAKSTSGIEEDARPVAQSPGIQVVRMEKNRAVLAIPSGTYTFTSELP